MHGNDDETVTEPLVSVITPVYNGEAYLANCIESVLSQTYTNWEYVIVNNCSTDRTPEIADDYARTDARIRLHHNTDFLDLMPNWNHALRQMNQQSHYCKVVHADDGLFPRCLELMVDVAKANPSVGIVGAYNLQNSQVGLDGLPYPSTVIPGRELGRSALYHIGRLGGHWVFGSPTSLLLRSDLISSRESFYNESNLHADSEVPLDLLRYSDFGFVHQVLTYTRLHDHSISAAHEIIKSTIPGELQILQKYGSDYLTSEEYQLCLRNKLKQYYVFLARSVMRRRRRAFWTYHQNELNKLGFPLSLTKLTSTLLVELTDHLFNPKQTLSKLVRQLTT